MSTYCNNCAVKAPPSAKFCSDCGTPLPLPPGKTEAHICLRSCKESMYEEGQRIGLTGAALDKFCYALYEVEIIIEVDHETGEYDLLGVKDGDQSVSM